MYKGGKEVSRYLKLQFWVDTVKAFVPLSFLLVKGIIKHPFNKR